MKLSPALIRFLKYTTVGTFSFIVDLVLLFLLTSVFSVYYIYSAAISFIIANSVNYQLNRKWGFKGTKQGVFKGYFFLMSINGLSLILIIIFLAFLVEIYSMHYLPARIIVGILVGILNFMANSKITFQKNIIKE